MIFAVLPVKSPKNAKQRLKDFLSAEAREQLARLMYNHVLDQILAARGIDRAVVATSDAIAIGIAQSRGITVFEETEQISHSHSADWAAARAEAMGASTVILLPIDVPLLEGAEITALAEAGAAQGGVIVIPSGDGTGTNALVRTPPNAIPSRFGPGSFAKHCQETESRGLPLGVLRLPGLLFDIDTPEDVEELLLRAPESAAARFLAHQLGRS